ncbi:MAG: hypothetical protein ACJAWS_001756 [Oleiphilaceae bacterium]|jgi:uncharacterized protein YcbX
MLGITKDDPYLMEYKISEIIYYPVKSLGAISVPEIKLDKFGIQNDRRFMLVDQNAEFITQRTYPKLSLVSVRLESDGLVFSSEGLGELFFPYNVFAHDIKVQVWSDVVNAKYIDSKYTAKLSNWLGVSVRLVYMEDSAVRQVDREFFEQDQNVSFADAFPLLLTNAASLGDLNDKLEYGIPMSRFRPNIVFEGDIAFQEDDWKRVSIAGIDFDLVKPCSRCGMTTINEKGELGKEPLKTLARYRKNEFGVCFGQNLVHRSCGTLKVGDLLVVKEFT